MLKRKIESTLFDWKDNRKQALLVTGARQVGKTYSISEFAKGNFKSFINIDFARQPDQLDNFVHFKNSDHFMIILSAIAGDKMIPNETIVFFDEIQVLYKYREELIKKGKISSLSLDLLTAMKSVVIEGKYRFILSGSMLGVSLKDVLLYPVGYLDRVQMFPLDFEEFLWARGVGETAINHLKECFEEKKEVFDGVHNMFLDYFNEYVLIGGMPEAVESYFTSKNLYFVAQTQKQIIDSYLIDITRYVENDEKKMRIREIYKAIPSELNERNKRFISSHVFDKAFLKKHNIVDEFLWLTFSSIAIPVYNVTEAIIPLMISSERRTLKLFYNDIGLLDSMLLTTGIREKLFRNEKVINYGAPFENVIAQELYAHGFDEKLYYYNSKKHGEVDFLIEYNNEVLPIEIKSGKTDEMNMYNHNALNNIIKMYKPKEAYVFGEFNVKKETDVIWHLPIYMIMFLQN